MKNGSLLHKAWLLSQEYWWLHFPMWIWRPICWKQNRNNNRFTAPHNGHDPWTERPGKSLYCIICHKDLM